MVKAEVFMWMHFNKTKPNATEWSVTLSEDNYVYLVDLVTTVGRQTGKETTKFENLVIFYRKNVG